MTSRNELRDVFFKAWEKHIKNSPLDLLETMIVDILLLHPEYHVFLNDPEQFQEKDFGDENPFLHLSLHLALREQLGTDRPKGIKALFQQLCQKKNALDVEHQMIDCLAEILWEAQRSNQMPDEEKYLERLKKI